MYNDFGKAFVAGAILGLLALVVSLAVVVVLVRRSWRWSRPGASFGALAYPLCLPVLGIAVARAFGNPIRPAAALVWVGLCTLAAVVILGRALWLRPGADIGSPAVQQRRRREIAVCAAGAVFLYALWALACLRFASQAAQSRATVVQREAVNEAGWLEGRIASSPRALCYSPDGRYLAAADTHLEIFDLTTGQVERTWPIQTGNVNAIPTLFGFDEGGQRLALSVGPDIEIFSLTGDRRKLLGSGLQSWSASGRQVRLLAARGAAIVLEHGTARALDLSTGEPLKLATPALQEPGIADLAVSADGGSIATWSPSKRQVAVWPAGNPNPLWTASEIELRRSVGIEFSADGRYLSAATSQNFIVVWDAATGAEQARFVPGRELRAFAISADGTRLIAVTTQSATSTAGPQLHVWSILDGRPVATHFLPVASGHFLALSPSSAEVAIVDSGSGHTNEIPVVRRFDTVTGVERRGFSLPPP